MRRMAETGSTLSPPQVNSQDAKSLMARAAHGFAWVFAWRMATRFMGLGSTLVLVRLLAPAEFGIVAIAMSFIQSIDLFSQIGVEDALVRMPAPDRRTYDTAFTMIVMRCGLIGVITAAAALPVAYFFNEPRLAPIMLAVAGVTVIAGFENIGVQDFRRELHFDKEFLFQAVPRLFGLIGVVTAAVIWHDYWALIFGTAVIRLTRVAMSYVIHPMRPRFSLSAWRDLIGFSLWTWAICVARVLRDQPSTFIIGRMLGPAGLGLLSIGGEIASLPFTEIVMPMGRSMFSAFAMARRSGEDVEAIFRRLTGVTAFITLPASVGLALVAEPLVRLMLGPNWVTAVPVLQLVAMGGAFSVFAQTCHAQFDAYGMLRQDFGVILFGAAIRTTLMAVLVSRFGLMGAAFACAAAALLEPLSYLAVKRHYFRFSLRALLSVAIRPVLATAGMAVIVLSLGIKAGEDMAGTIGQLALGGLTGAAAYAILIMALWWLAGRPEGAEADIVAMIAKRRPVVNAEPVLEGSPEL